MPTSRWGALALLLGLACHRSAETQGGPEGRQPPPPRLTADATAERVRVFLISPGDGGRSGRAVGCGDSAVPVEVPLARPQPALAGALSALLAMRGSYDRSSGLVNALYASPLALVRVERAGGLARVILSGYIELAGGCENARMVAELTETARQFADVSRVELILDGQPLAALLQAGAPLAGPPPAAPPR
jgi:hypothetical protein